MYGNQTIYKRAYLGPRVVNTMRLHIISISWFRQGKKWRKLAYDPDQVISLVQAVEKQRTNLWNYDKLNFPLLFLHTGQNGGTNYTRKDHWEIVGNWAEWGGVAHESLFNNYSPKWRWIVMDIYRAAKRRGKYTSLSPTLRWIIVLVYTTQAE